MVDSLVFGMAEQMVAWKVVYFVGKLVVYLVEMLVELLAVL